MSDDDLTYYCRRIELELELAQQATSREAVAAHSQLADAYLERIAVEPVRQIEDV